VGQNPSCSVCKPGQELQETLNSAIANKDFCTKY